MGPDEIEQRRLGPVEHDMNGVVGAAKLISYHNMI